MKISGETIVDIEQFLYLNRGLFTDVDGKKLSELSGKSKTYSDEKIIDSISETVDENGKINIKNLANPRRVNILINPADALEKIQKLRQFKKEISISNQDENMGNNTGIAKEKIKDLYRKKVNTLIASQAYAGIWANELNASLGEIGYLSEDEQRLQKTVPGLLKFEEVFSRYDRFIHGADTAYDENGMRRQVGIELLEYADGIEIKLLTDDFERESKIKEKGLEPKKISKKDITAEEFSKWAEDLLEFYGEKSSSPPEDYDPKRKGAAPDNKWQFIAREEYKSMAVNSKQKIIKSGTKEKSITEALGTLMGHEFTHFMQAQNRTKIPLRLFSEKMGGLRSDVFSEGGAMAMESDVTKELFGYENNPKPHYIRAMAKKLEGGNYLECVEAYYNSSLKNALNKRGEKSNDDFKKELNGLIKTAVGGAKRLFRDEDKFDGTGTYLTKSKDTVYAEQVVVMDKLRKSGIENCAFVKGVNLDTLATLMEIGLVNLDEIQKPNLDPIIKIWEEIRPKYELA